MTVNQNKVLMSAIQTLLWQCKFYVDDIASNVDELAAQGDTQKISDALTEVAKKHKLAVQNIEKKCASEKDTEKADRELGREKKIGYSRTLA